MRRIGYGIINRRLARLARSEGLSLLSMPRIRLETDTGLVGWGAVTVSMLASSAAALVQ